MPRIFTALQQARDSVRGAANGLHGQQRITLSDGITPSRLPTLLALSWQEEPDVELRLVEGLGHTTRPLLPDDPAIRFKPIAHLGQIVVARRGHGSHAAATELAPFDLRTASTTRRRVHLPAAILDARGRTGVGHAVSLDLSGS